MAARRKAVSTTTTHSTTKIVSYSIDVVNGISLIFGCTEDMVEAKGILDHAVGSFTVRESSSIDGKGTTLHVDGLPYGQSLDLTALTEEYNSLFSRLQDRLQQAGYTFSPLR